MYDLHSHILPGIDDGATDLAVSIAMARQAAASGVKVLACTPHIMPGVYNNSGPQIRQAVAALQTELDREGVAHHGLLGIGAAGPPSPRRASAPGAVENEAMERRKSRRSIL